MNLLIPGRHLAQTRFQQTYLNRILSTPLSELDFYEGRNPHVPPQTCITHMIFAITSANQCNSRYNPIPFPIRAVSTDRFARVLKDAHDVSYSILGIPHYPKSGRFADTAIKEINEQRRTQPPITPQNTVIMLSTPEVIPLYRKLGYSVLPAELDWHSGSVKEITPIQAIKTIADAGETWAKEKTIKATLSRSSRSVFFDFPDIIERLLWLYRDPLLNDDGGITDERDYEVYGQAMSNPAALECKYRDIRSGIREGKIADEGCADGALLVHIARDFPDSDLYGIEITSRFLQEAQNRKQRGEYGESFVVFRQMNCMNPVFEDNSINTVICNSTLHELWSYIDQEKSLRTYLRHKLASLVPGGRLVIRDVTGPFDKDKPVLLWANDKDGTNQNPLAPCGSSKELKKHLDSLSTRARFIRFAYDFLREMREKNRRKPDTAISFEEVTIDKETYFRMRLKDAQEFISRKDYTESWLSELNEEFAFYDFDEWKRLLADEGFEIIENASEPLKGSRAYVNEWIVENSYNDSVALYEETDRGLANCPWPVTNMVLIAQKPGN